MLIRPVEANERGVYDKVVDHPLQSFIWGEFKKSMGQKVERIGFFANDGSLEHALQVTYHDVPVLGGTVGYVPKSFMPDQEQLQVLKDLAEKHQTIFTKLEPNVATPVVNSASNTAGFAAVNKFMLNNGARVGKPLFTKYNFHLNLTPSIDDLFANLASKTRYNVRLAMKKGVQIIEDTSESGMETFIRLMLETTNRKKFFSHTPEYYRAMWKTIGRDKESILHIFHAVYNNQVLVSWIIFVFNGKIYYPYGASSDAYKEVMASNLMMWEAISYGHDKGCSVFDMWGSLGPEPNKKDAWYGFHHFKEGYNPTLMENLGTYDLVYNNLNYQLFNLADNLRWMKLRLLGR
jgi:lipid II:glycine glycyltransferase (peptidoglycan interpeptide bridge formation enzyme)